MKPTIKVLYNKGLIDIYNHGNAHEVLLDNLFIEVNDRRRPDLEEVTDVIQYFC